MQEKSASENARTPERRSAIGSRLRANRTMRHLTLRELARRVGVSPSLISQIETGRSQPSVGHALRDRDRARGLASTICCSTATTSGPSGGRARRDDLGSSAGGPVQRAHNRRAISLDSGVRWERLTTQHDDDVEFLDVVYDVGGASSAAESLTRHAGSRVRPRAERPPRRDARVRGARARARRLDLVRLDDAAPPGERGRRAGARDLVRRRSRPVDQGVERSADGGAAAGVRKVLACPDSSSHRSVHPCGVAQRRVLATPGARRLDPRSARCRRARLHVRDAPRLARHRRAAASGRLEGLVWRIARPFDPAVLRQVSEADVGKNVVVVFSVVGMGATSSSSRSRAATLVRRPSAPSPTRSASPRRPCRARRVAGPSARAAGRCAARGASSRFRMMPSIRP